jgi:hypothetical protein
MIGGMDRPTPGTALAAALAAVAAVCAGGCAEPFFEATTVLRDTPDSDGPYMVQAVAIGVSRGDRVLLHFSVEGDAPGAFGSQAMVPAEDDDGVHRGERFSRGIPGQLPGTEILYFVSIERDGERVAEDPVGGEQRPIVFRILP